MQCLHPIEKDEFLLLLFLYFIHIINFKKVYPLLKRYFKITLRKKYSSAFSMLFRE